MAAIEGARPDGSPVVVELPGRSLVAFLTGSCLGCGWWWEHLVPPAGLPPLGAVVTPDPSLEPPGKIAELAPSGVPLVMSSDTWNHYSVRQSTTFLLLDDGEVMARAVASSWRDLLTIPAFRPA